MTVKEQERIDPQIKKKLSGAAPTILCLTQGRVSVFMHHLISERTVATQILAEMNSYMEVPGCLGSSLLKYNSLSSQHSYASSDKIRYCLISGKYTALATGKHIFVLLTKAR